MLDVGNRQAEVAQWIYTLPCPVQLPQKLRDEFEKTGAVPVPPDDVRRYRRVYCRGEKQRAALELKQNLPALARETVWQSVYTGDFSKQGCSFLHAAILYPGEKLRLILLTGAQRTVEVAWCRRLDKFCYAVGTRFVETEPDPATENLSANPVAAPGSCRVDSGSPIGSKE